MTKITLKTPLYLHQKNSLKFHLTRLRSADWSDMGVGKTLTTLAKLRSLYNSEVIDRALVVCPLSVLETWKREIVKHTSFTYTLLIGSLDTKIHLLRNTNTPIYLISYDSIPGRERTLGILLHELLEKKFDIIICDECTHVKNYGALRTQAITVLCESIKQTLFLSGTPITNSPQEVLTIYKAMDGGETFGKNFFAARNKYFENRGYSFPDWHLKKSMSESFHKMLYKNAIRLRKTECLSLPSKVFNEKFIPLSEEQLGFYVPVAEELLKVIETNRGKISIKNGLTKLQKLSQITSGFAYTDKEPFVFAHNSKLDALNETISEIPEEDKIIIFCHWRQDIDIIRQSLDSQGIGNVILHGAIKNRGDVLTQFIDNPDIRVLISQIRVGAFGLNLPISHQMIYYSMSFSLIEYLQSQDRIHRSGQTKTCFYMILQCKDTIDEYIYDTLKKGENLSSALINPVSIERLKQNLQLVKGE